jgi:imidazolonepropionase-like amidohydrolase
MLSSYENEWSSPQENRAKRRVISMAESGRTIVIRNGTLIDGSGARARRNEAVVIEGNRIKSVGALPPDIDLEDRRKVAAIDAAGQWIMPGLIDAHCHVSYGYPVVRGEGKGRGTTRPEFSTLKAAHSVQRVLRSGVTSISVPGGTWFTDVGVRDAIRLGLMEGPRMYVAGRMIVTYGCIEDDEPSWEGTPDHSIGKLCNTADEMVTEVRRQSKHGVNFIKMADSRSGESQMLAKEEIATVVAEAHRRNLRVGIHSRGAGSTRAAAEAGVDWIIHADLATDRDLEAVAKAGKPIIPTATFLAMVVELGSRVGSEQVQLDIDRMKRHFDLLCALMHKARKLGIKLLVGTDTGNNTFMPYGELHAKELEIFVKYGGFSPLEAIVAATRDNAYAVGLEGQLGEIEPGRLADIIALDRDPLADITVLQGGKHLAWVIKDGKVVDLQRREDTLAFREAAE